MDTQTRDQGVFAFGLFRLDPVRRVLLRDGVPVKLSARLFDTLLYLVQNHDRLVEHQELEQAVWRGRLVEEGNVGKAVRSLRLALNAEDATANLIVTVAGRGYRFAAPVVFEAEPTPNLAAEPTNWSPPPAHVVTHLSPSVRPLWRSPLYLSVAAISLLVAASAVLWPLRHAMRSPQQAEPPQSEAAPFAPPPHSVAVMAFTNLSGDPSQEYFSDGVSEELIDTLGRIGTLRVAARISSFSFKGTRATIGDIARQLGVAHVLEGSVRRDGTRLRVTAQLIDAATGFQCWSHTYDLDEGDILKVQEAIGSAVAASLKVTLLDGDLPNLSIGGTKSPKALEAYLHGLTFDDRIDPASVTQALAAFSEAIALDPNFADARVQHALLISDVVEFGAVPDAATSRQMLDGALAETNTAITIAPGLGRAHMARAMILMDRSLDFSQAAVEFARARTLAPSDPFLDLQQGLLDAYLGDFESAVATAQQGIVLDPINPGLYLKLAEIYFLSRRYDDALAAVRHAQQFGDIGITRGMGLTGFIKLMTSDAQAAIRACAAGRDVLEIECNALAYHALGRTAQAASFLARLQAIAGDHATYNYAEIYAQWGQTADAVHWLKRAQALHDGGLIILKVDPFLDPLHRTPEFAEIERQLAFRLEGAPARSP